MSLGAMAPNAIHSLMSFEEGKYTWGELGRGGVGEAEWVEIGQVQVVAAAVLAVASVASVGSVVAAATVPG